MTSSAYKPYVVRGISLGSAEPCDALTMRDAISSAAHLADQSAQVRVAWSSSTGVGKTTALADFSGRALIWRSGPWLARAATDGLYRLRVRIAGARVGASGTARFTLALSPHPYVIGAREVAAMTATSTSTSIAWLSAGGITVLRAGDAPIMSWPTRTAIGGITTGVDAYPIYASVSLHTEPGDADGLLHGVYIAEVY